MNQSTLLDFHLQKIISLLFYVPMLRKQKGAIPALAFFFPNQILFHNKNKIWIVVCL